LCFDNLTDNLTKEEEETIKQLRIFIYGNLSACYLKLSNFKEVIQNSSEALKLNPNNVKVLYRRSKAHSALKEFDESKLDLESGLKLEPNNEELKRELTMINQQLNFANKKQKQFCSRMFEALEKQDSLYTDEDIKRSREEHRKATMKYCASCDVDVEEIQWARHVIKYHDPSRKKDQFQD